MTGISPIVPVVGGIGPIGGIWAVPTIPGLGSAVTPAGFRLADLPSAVVTRFKSGPAQWPAALKEAIDAGIVDPTVLANLVFFMHHRERMSSLDVGRPIDPDERRFVVLRAEWDHCFEIVSRVLNPTHATSVFLPERARPYYEEYIQPATTGRITLLVNGRSRHGSASAVDERKDAFDAMQTTVEALRRGDSLYIANWQFSPGRLPLTIARSGLANWGDLLVRKAEEGVVIRVLVSLHSVGNFMTDLDELDAVVVNVPEPQRDNFKYLVTPHANLLATHHQKFVLARREDSITAFCGGLDISFNRTPPSWSNAFVWHDVHAKLEGRITRDLEREFVMRWNRERAKAIPRTLPGWKRAETLSQSSARGGDTSAVTNPHPLQMLRTVSTVAADGFTWERRREDIWRGYFRLVARAKRFIYLENQYFHAVPLAEAIVRQAQAHPDLVVIVFLGTGTDDNAFIASQMRFFRREFFKRLMAGIPKTRRRFFTPWYPKGILHSKLILVDDEALCMGSCNANPRGFFTDSELNVMLEDPKEVRAFRHRLWAHDLGEREADVKTWREAEFIEKWQRVADHNKKHTGDVTKMVGADVIPFDPDDKADPRAHMSVMTPIPDEIYF
jgi:phosphatidylserine/phosphatidylglycerophosphate/cardiolipin synthase-like enzyme